MKKLIHVAVGVIFDCAADNESAGNILIAKRGEDQHQGGLWEFPGGKVEAGEKVQEALERELEEELGLKANVNDMSPIITIPFHYPDKSVLLDVWAVHNVHHSISAKEGADNEGQKGISREGIGKEGQPIAWVAQNELANYDFPAANKAILDALHLPKKIIISQDNIDPEIILAQVANSLKNHGSLQGDRGLYLHLRAPSLDQVQYTQLAMRLYGICHEAGGQLIWNCPLDWYQVAFADGLHLSGENFISYQLSANDKSQRPIPPNQWLSLSCHNLNELELAQEFADYVLVSPVKETQTHPSLNPLTWAGFKVISDHARIPCYALGGLTVSDIESAIEYGGQGIAGISCFLSEQLASTENKESSYES